MAFPGDIKLKNPQLEIGVFEEYEFDGMRGKRMLEKREQLGVSDVKGKRKERDEEVWDGEQDAEKLRGVWVGRKVRVAFRSLVDVACDTDREFSLSLDRRLSTFFDRLL